MSDEKVISNDTVLAFCDNEFPCRVDLSARMIFLDVEKWLIEEFGPDALTDANDPHATVWKYDPEGLRSFCYRPDLTVSVYFKNERIAMLFAIKWKR